MTKDSMKIMTVLGTRPEIIRLSRIIGKLDRLCEHVLVHTEQNFDPVLSDVFFRELGVRRPDHLLGVREPTFAAQAGLLLPRMDEVLAREAPGRLLILGDTNSALAAAITAKRRRIEVLHMEAGNRCFDDRVPEEVNRRIIDHASDVWLPYTERSRSHLLREGIPSDRIHVVGNPIFEAMRSVQSGVAASTALRDLGVEEKRFFLATLHRAENVDDRDRLRDLLRGLGAVAEEHDCPIVVSTHPRTRARMQEFGLEGTARKVRFLPPFGFLDFLALERGARCVLTDSGTVQEECAIGGVPCVTLRDTTERPETIECGGNILGGTEPEALLRCVRAVLELGGGGEPPAGYRNEKVSDVVVKILLAARRP